jgi:hypothetical protein
MLRLQEAFMLKVTKAAVLAVALAVPVAAFAQATAPAKKSTAHKEAAASTAKVASKTTTGTVKSVSDSSLVIEHGTGKSAKEETFTVNASTKKDGDIATGSKVTVAYTTEGSTMTATSIKASAAHAAAKKPAKK